MTSMTKQNRGLKKHKTMIMKQMKRTKKHHTKMLILMKLMKRIMKHKTKMLSRTVRYIDSS